MPAGIRGVAKLVSLIAIAACGVDPTGPIASRSGTFEFIDGRWFDGETFVSRTMFTVSGVLTTTRPADIDDSFDLSGKFITPPLAESHTHTLIEGHRIREFLDQGIFYASVIEWFA